MFMFEFALLCKVIKNHALDDIGDRKGTSCINYLDLKY